MMSNMLRCAARQRWPRLLRCSSSPAAVAPEIARLRTLVDDYRASTRSRIELQRTVEKMNDVLSEEQKPSSELLNEYLRAVVKVSAKEAVKVFDNLDKNQLTESSLAMVLRACAATGNASGAKEALRFLYNNGYPLRPAYLAHTIEVFAASNDIETSLRLLREMKEAN
eukprot:Sspe_Gene.76058::Locus_47518_Transcript_1_1_Confidence_1.000_Length_554::g.76058::m.76058